MASIYGYPGGNTPLFMNSLAAPGLASQPFLTPLGGAPSQASGIQANPMAFFDQLDQAIYGALQVGGPVPGLSIPNPMVSTPLYSSMGSLEDLISNPVYQQYSVSNLLAGLNWQAIYQILATPPQQMNAAGPVQPQEGNAQPISRSASTAKIEVGGEKAVDQWDAYIQASAQRNGLDPNLVKAVIYQESRGNPNAKSGKDARGLMQLIPGTFASFKNHLSGLFGPERAGNAFDPEVNIEAGCAYLAEMKAKFGSNELALAAYNAGPGNVKKYGGVPPFSETQKYVATISERYQTERQSGSNEA